MTFWVLQRVNFTFPIQFYNVVSNNIVHEKDILWISWTTKDSLIEIFLEIGNNPSKIIHLKTARLVHLRLTHAGSVTKYDDALKTRTTLTNSARSSAPVFLQSFSLSPATPTAADVTELLLQRRCPDAEACFENVTYSGFMQTNLPRHCHQCNCCRCGLRWKVAWLADVYLLVFWRIGTTRRQTAPWCSPASRVTAPTRPHFSCRCFSVAAPRKLHKSRAASYSMAAWVSSKLKDGACSHLSKRLMIINII